MIKPKLAKRLALTTETIRALDAVQLETVVGGMLAGSATSCICTARCTKDCPG